MSRAVLQVFEVYQSARTTFVQTVAELAHRPQNIEALQNADVMALLRPLLLDSVPSIQQSAALALGRLANYSEALAEAVVMNDVLPQLVYSLSENNRFYKKTAAFVLKSVAKHSPELAQSVVEAGALDSLVSCLSEFEPSVKESAAWALGFISQHTPELAQSVVDAGAVPPLVLCLQEPELSLKRIAASTLSEIAKHSGELSQIIVDAGAIPYLAPLIHTHPDAKLKRQILSCLSQIAKHSIDLAEIVVAADVFSKCFLNLKDSDMLVKRNAATLIREICKHSIELSQLVVNQGGHSALIQFVSGTKGSTRLPGIMAIGYISAFNETLATSIIVKNGIIPLKEALVQETEDHIKAAIVWTLGQIGRHSPDHAKALATNDILKHLNDLYESAHSSPDLKNKCQSALKSIIMKCTHLAALEPLLLESSPTITKYLIQQFAKVLPNNPQARKSFVTSRCLAKVQQLKNDEKSKLQEYIGAINSCYPAEIIQFYSPNYAETLMQKLDQAS